MKVAIIILSHIKDEAYLDPRASKAAGALVRAGHEVVILGIGKEGKHLPKREVVDGFVILRQVTILQRLYNWLIAAPATVGLQGDKRFLDYREQKKPSWMSRLLARILMLRHNLNLLLFYLMVIPEAIRQNADVYIGYDLPGLRPAALVSFLRRVPLVYDSAELWIERVRGVPYNRFQKAFVRWEEGLLCRRCDLVITMSDSAAEILCTRYSIPTPTVILNVPPYVEATPSCESRLFLTQGDSNRQVAVYVGFLDYGRGLKELVDAAKYLEGMTIALLGDGILRPVLEDRIKAKQLEHQVHLVGWVPREKVLDYVASADVGVSAVEGKWLNCYHTLDNKLFDYTMAGTPLAVSNHPAKRVLIERYDIGATFDETDPRDIARAIRSLLADPDRYEQMRANCLKAAREELNWDVVSKKYVAAIEALRKGRDQLPNRLEHT